MDNKRRALEAEAALAAFLAGRGDLWEGERKTLESALKILRQYT